MKIDAFLSTLTVYKADDGTVWCVPLKTKEMLKKYGEQPVFFRHGFEVDTEEDGNECLKLVKKYISDTASNKLDITVRKDVQGTEILYEVLSPGVKNSTKIKRIAYEQLIILLAEHYMEQGRGALSNLAKALLFTVDGD